jgi:hypothetical protein
MQVKALAVADHLQRMVGSAFVVIKQGDYPLLSGTTQG